MGRGERKKQRRLIGGRSALVGVVSKVELDHSVSQLWAERTYSGHDRDNILYPFPINRINLRWARTNSHSLRLTYDPFPTFLDRGNLWTRSKIAPDLPDHAAPLPLIAAQFTITAVQFTFIPDWSRFSDRVISGTDRSPVEWGYSAENVSIWWRHHAKDATLGSDIGLIVYGDMSPDRGRSEYFDGLITIKSVWEVKMNKMNSKN